VLNKCSDCNVCKATEDLIAEYIKSTKEGTAKNEQIAKIIYPEEVKVDLRKINLDAFKEKRQKFKSIIVLINKFN